jgi:threonylcarbamoyladenosine tRNA methylthiotransferase MtaB
MRIHLKTLGCRLNEAELETWSQDFQARGHQMTDQPEEADLLVVNTCAVTQEAVRKSRKLLNRSGRENPNAHLVVSGCYASLEPDAAKKIEGVDLVVGNQDKSRLVEIIEQNLNLKLMSETAMETPATGHLKRGRQRAFIKVQDGCRYRCTFCIVTLARGTEYSRPEADIIEEINQLHQQGVQEVVLTGVHIGGYGCDLGTTLADLIGNLLKYTEIPRLRIGSIEPWDLGEDFWTLFSNPRLMPHLHLPLQSGSDAVLRHMARRCRSNEYRQLICQARNEIKDFNVTTDIIVGFPGESIEQWRQTLDFVKEIGFGDLHIFAYSPRLGTHAANFPDPVSREIKKARSEALHQLGERLKRETLEKYLGRTFPVLIEGSKELGWSGYTPNYLRIKLAPSCMPREQLGNRIVPCKLLCVTERGDALLARAVHPETQQ